MRLACAMAALLVLGGCGQADKAGQGGGQGGGASQDRFSGLDGAILAWRQDILRTSELCQSQAAGQKCESFDVACKAERPVTAEDQAKGVTARIVASIDWTGWDPKLKHGQMGSQAAEFTKTGGVWTRAAHAPVNLGACSDL